MSPATHHTCGQKRWVNRTAESLFVETSLAGEWMVLLTILVNQRRPFDKHFVTALSASPRGQVVWANGLCCRQGLARFGP